MISVLTVKELSVLDKLYSDAGIEKNEKSWAVRADSNGAMIGFCLFELTDKGILIRYISPEGDIMLADGLLRSALHIAAERSAMDAKYAETVSEELLEKIDFISDRDNKALNIDKLFGGCGCKGDGILSEK